MLAYACAIARAYPAFSMKTIAAPKILPTVEVGFIEKTEYVINQEDLDCLTAMAEGVHLAQKIVDMPPNEMHTDAFLDVSLGYYIISLH